MIDRNEVQSLAKSFVYAFRGIVFCVKNERNMRIHISAVLLISYFSYFYGLTKGEYIALFLCFGAVISAEAFNTAIESAVDLESPSYHHYARIAKDAAAGAVLVTAFASAAVGVVLFLLDFKRLGAAFCVLFQNPVSGLIFVLLIVFCVLFIINGPYFYGKKRAKKGVSI